MGKPHAATDYWDKRVSQDADLFATWNAKLAAADLPEELPLIRRPRDPRRKSSALPFEDNNSLADLDRLPPLPKPRPPSNRHPTAEEHDLAVALLRSGKLTEAEREIWILYSAGIPEREIAKRVGRSREYVRKHFLIPLKARAGIELGEVKTPKHRNLRRLKKPTK